MEAKTLRFLTAIVATGVGCVCATAPVASQAGGELSEGAAERRAAGVRVAAAPIERSPLRGPAVIPRDPPLPAPDRPVGWGFCCNEAYGPTYYHPSTKSYEGLHPTYYPFFHPRLWPNYKVPAPAAKLCGSSRSQWAWDSYDDWTRGARYEERQ